MQKKLKLTAVKYFWLCEKYTPKHAVLQKAISKCAIQRSQHVVEKKGLHFSEAHPYDERSLRTIIWQMSADEFPGSLENPAWPPESAELQAEGIEHWKQFMLFT